MQTQHYTVLYTEQRNSSTPTNIQIHTQPSGHHPLPRLQSADTQTQPDNDNLSLLLFLSVSASDQRNTFLSGRNHKGGKGIQRECSALLAGECTTTFLTIISRYCDKTQHNTTFMSLNIASLNVIVSKRKSIKTQQFQNVNVKKRKDITAVSVMFCNSYVL